MVLLTKSVCKLVLQIHDVVNNSLLLYLKRDKESATIIHTSEAPYKALQL